MKKFVFLLIVLLAAGNFAFAQMPLALDKLKEIRLLESDNNDMRRILAGYRSEPFDESDTFDKFYTDDAEIEVDYSEGACEEDDGEGFNVPRWKVENVRITLKNPMKPKTLGINLSKYKKEKMFYDIDDLYVYYDKEAGIVYEVDDGKLETIRFIPPDTTICCVTRRRQKNYRRLQASLKINWKKDKDRLFVLPQMLLKLK